MLSAALGSLTALGEAGAASYTDLAVFKDIDLSNSRDPRISKFYVGDTVRYSLQVVNNGSVAVSGATLTDVAETGLEGLTWSCTVVKGDAQCPAPSGTGLPNFTIPKLGANSELRITYSAKVAAVDAQLTNTAQIALPAGFIDTNPVNNKDSVYICTFDTDTTLTLAKSSNGPWTVGQSGAQYTLTVGNNSNFDTQGTVTVRDLLPSGITPVSSSFTSAPNWSCTTSGQLVTCTTSQPVVATKTLTLTIPVKVGSAAVGTVTNRAAVGGGGDPDPTPDPATCVPGTTNPANQCAQTITTVTAPPTDPNVPVPTQCTTLYGLMIPSTGSRNGRTINVIDPRTNAVGTRVATLPTVGGSYGTALTSAALALSPDGRTFYVATDAYGSVPTGLWSYNTATATWTQLGTFSGVDGRIVRMTMTRSGVGYAMDAVGNLWSFTTGGSVQSLGKLTPTGSTGPGFYDNGDFFATADGKLYLLSAETGGNVSLWFVDPRTLKAEYLGNLTSASESVQYNGLAALPGAVYAANSAGELATLDLTNISLTSVGSRNIGSTDLASCYYPDYAPRIEVTKSARKVGGDMSTPVVQPGDVLEFTIVVRNAGELPAGGVSFTDPLPQGVTYVADSARINGATSTVYQGREINLAGSTYPFAQPLGVCSLSSGACTNQVLRVDTTPGTLDQEAVVTFRVRVDDPFTKSDSKVVNQAVVTYTDEGTPSKPIPSNPVEVPVNRPVKLNAVKTVQNITAGGPVGTTGSGKPGDVLEYCITTSNVGSGVATNLRFSDVVPTNTIFQLGGYGLSGQDVRYTGPNGVRLLSAAADGDPATLSGGRVLVNGIPSRLEPGQQYQVCFRTTIR
ncbi:hypothetical protein ACTQ9L_03875 [Deinococcus wulumuqiensis]